MAKNKKKIKNNKKETKQKDENFNILKEAYGKDNKIFKFQEKFQEKLSLIHKNKIILWLILFPPIGIYKAYKHKVFNKWVGIIVGILLSLFVILCVDVAINPNRVIDTQITKLVNESDSIGTVKYVTYMGTVKNKYILYDVLTNKGKYTLYIGVDNNNKYSIEKIYQVLPTIDFIKNDENSDDTLNEVVPQILLFFENEENVKEYGELEALLNTANTTQTIKTSKGTYCFEVKFDSVIQITEVFEDGSIGDVLYKSNCNFYLPKKVISFMKDNQEYMGTYNYVSDCIIYEDKIDFIVRNVSGTLFKIEYRDNQTLVLYTQN